MKFSVLAVFPLLINAQYLWYTSFQNKSANVDVKLDMYFSYLAGRVVGVIKGGYIKNAAGTGAFNNSNSFAYHIHENSVINSNCTATGGHLIGPFLNPSVINTPIPGNLATYEAGDLAGKFGSLKVDQEGNILMSVFLDPSINFMQDSDACIVNKAIVIHAADKTRLGCGNILPLL